MASTAMVNRYSLGWLVLCALLFLLDIHHEAAVVEATARADMVRQARRVTARAIRDVRRFQLPILRPAPRRPLMR